MSESALLAIFKAANLFTLPFWLLLFFGPRTRWADRLLSSQVAPLTLAIAYLVAIAPVVVQDSTVIKTLSRPELSSVITLLAAPAGATVAWIHFLCFDLFVAAYIRQKAIERNHSFIWVSPVLFLTLMFGPLGFLLFSLISKGMQTKGKKNLA